MGTDSGTLAALRLPASASAAGVGMASPSAPADRTVAPGAGGAAELGLGGPACDEGNPPAHGPAGAAADAGNLGACKPGTPISTEGATSQTPARNAQLPDGVGADKADWNLLEDGTRPAGSATPLIDVDGDAAGLLPDPAAATGQAAGRAAAPTPDQAVERAPDAAAAPETSESCESVARSSQARACHCGVAAGPHMTVLGMSPGAGSSPGLGAPLPATGRARDYGGPAGPSGRLRAEALMHWHKKTNEQTKARRACHGASSSRTGARGLGAGWD